MTLSFKAMLFAREVHRNQVRKYTHNPYVDHLAEVAGIVGATFASSPEIDVMLAVAWLHDCVEDQGVTLEQLTEKFGEEVAQGVMWLSDLEQGSRAQRMEASRQRLSRAPAWVQSIKVADLISNTSSIVKHDPKFARTYLEEKRKMLAVLTKADPKLVQIASTQCVADQPEFPITQELEQARGAPKAGGKTPAMPADDQECVVLLNSGTRVFGRIISGKFYTYEFREDHFVDYGIDWVKYVVDVLPVSFGHTKKHT